LKTRACHARIIRIIYLNKIIVVDVVVNVVVVDVVDVSVTDGWREGSTCL